MFQILFCHTTTMMDHDDSNFESNLRSQPEVLELYKSCKWVQNDYIEPGSPITEKLIGTVTDSIRNPNFTTDLRKFGFTAMEPINLTSFGDIIQSLPCVSAMFITADVRADKFPSEWDVFHMYTTDTSTKKYGIVALIPIS